MATEQDIKFYRFFATLSYEDKQRVAYGDGPKREELKRYRRFQTDFADRLISLSKVLKPLMILTGHYPNPIIYASNNYRSASNLTFYELEEDIVSRSTRIMRSLR